MTEMKQISVRTPGSYGVNASVIVPENVLKEVQEIYGERDSFDLSEVLNYLFMKEGLRLEYEARVAALMNPVSEGKDS